jgi:hypothetical protein
MGCNCKNIKIGSYENQIVLTMPKKLVKERNVTRPIHGIDTCLSEEIKNLWNEGILTTGCCCGHNIKGVIPYIGVEFEDIPKMKKLGYKVKFNNLRPNDEDSFIPKSIKIEK